VVTKIPVADVAVGNDPYVVPDPSLFLAGDGRRQQIIIAAKGGGSYDEGHYVGEFEERR
jgi:hypothetical protein